MSNVDFYYKREQDIIERFSNGQTLQEIGIIYGISRERVRQILEEVGITGSEGGISIKTKSIHRKVTKLIETGYLLEDIEDKTGIGTHRIKNIADRYNLKIISRGREKIIKRQLKVNELHQLGLTQKDIGEELGIAQTTVSQILTTEFGLKRVSESEVDRMTEEGYTAKKISETLNTGVANVYRIRRKNKEVNTCRTGNH